MELLYHSGAQLLHPYHKKWMNIIYISHPQPPQANSTKKNTKTSFTKIWVFTGFYPFLKAQVFFAHEKKTSDPSFRPKNLGARNELAVSTKAVASQTKKIGGGVVYGGRVFW